MQIILKYAVIGWYKYLFYQFCDIEINVYNLAYSENGPQTLVEKIISIKRKYEININETKTKVTVVNGQKQISFSTKINNIETLISEPKVKKMC